MSNQITIRMPKKMLAKWLKALRSGEYKQAKGALFDPATHGFCCLGVLQHCVDGGVEFYNIGEVDEEPRHLPSIAWLEDAGITFVGNDGGNPSLGRATAADLNDGGKSFKSIANLIEKHAEGY